MISEKQLRNKVRLAAFKFGSQKEYAASLGVSEAAFSLFASGTRKPSKRLLELLGYEKVTGYRPKARQKNQKVQGGGNG